MELHITSARPSWSAAARDLIAYRDLLWILAYREISIRYKQTALGFLWVVLQTAVPAALSTFVFGHLARLPSDGIPYGLFSFAGMTLWGFFAAAVGRASLSVIADEKLITKVYFPRAVIPLAAIVSSSIDFLVTLVLLFIVALVYGYLPGFATLAMLPAVAITLMASAGLGTALAGWTVRYRDFRYVVPVFLQFAIYATPIFYSVALVHEKYPSWAFLFYLNPMTGAAELFRYGISGTTPLDGLGLVISALISLVLFLAGGLIFRRVEQSFADHI